MKPPDWGTLGCTLTIRWRIVRGPTIDPEWRPVSIHDVQPTPRYRCCMAAFMHFATTCLSRHIPSCQCSPTDNRPERKHPQFCFQVVHNPTPHLGQVAQPASDVCQVPEQRFSDLPVSALGTRPPVLLYNQPPTASMTSPVIDSWFLLLVHVWIPDSNRPYLEKPCRFNGFSQGLRQAIALWILDAPIREAYIAHHPDHFFDLMGALWYTHYDRALIEATHVVNLALLGPYLDIKPHDLRYAYRTSMLV